MLHTKSQAGRTQKSGPPATRFECHLLRCTVKLRTACEKGKGKNREEKRQHNYKMLELEAGVVTHWMACRRARSTGKSIYCMRQRRQTSLHWQKWSLFFPVGTMLATLCCFVLSKYINWVKGKWMSRFYAIVQKALNSSVVCTSIPFYPNTQLFWIFFKNFQLFFGVCKAGFTATAQTGLSSWVLELRNHVLQYLAFLSI